MTRKMGRNIGVAGEERRGGERGGRQVTDGK